MISTLNQLENLPLYVLIQFQCNAICQLQQVSVRWNQKFPDWNEKKRKKQKLFYNFDILIKKIESRKVIFRFLDKKGVDDSRIITIVTMKMGFLVTWPETNLDFGENTHPLMILLRCLVWPLFKQNLVKNKVLKRKVGFKFQPMHLALWQWIQWQLVPYCFKIQLVS